MAYNWQWTPEELLIIRAQLLTGAKSVTIGDRRVDFRDMSEIDAIIGYPGTAGTGPRRVSFITEKGL